MTPEHFGQELDSGRRDFAYLTISGSVTIGKKVVTDGDLTLREIVVEGSLFCLGPVKGSLILSKAVVERSLILTGATIERDLVLTGATVREDVILAGTTVKGNVLCGKNVALGLVCLFAFGSKIQVDYSAIRQILKTLSVPAEHAA